LEIILVFFLIPGCAAGLHTKGKIQDARFFLSIQFDFHHTGQQVSLCGRVVFVKHSDCASFAQVDRFEARFLFFC